MSSRRLLPLAVLALTWAAWVRASDPKYQQKVDAVLKKAEAERKAKKLDTKQLYAAYPTPEVTFTAAEACPGATVPLKVTGTFPAGTAFVVQSDDVDVSDEKVGDGTYEVKLSVKPTATPHGVSLLAIAPVSATQRSFVALNIGCKLTWRITLDTQETLTVRAEWPKGGMGVAKGEAEWKRGPKTLDKSGINISGSAPSFSFDRLATQAEISERMQAMSAAMASPKAQAVNKKREAAMEKMNGCMKLQADTQKMMACMTPIQAELEKVNAEQSALMTTGTAPKGGCEHVDVEVADGKLTGEADRCWDGKKHKLTGTVKGEL